MASQFLDLVTESVVHRGNGFVSLKLPFLQIYLLKNLKSIHCSGRSGPSL